MNEIKNWILANNKFIEEASIQSIKREGRGTRIVLLNGTELSVQISYEKILSIIPKLKK